MLFIYSLICDIDFIMVISRSLSWHTSLSLFPMRHVLLLWIVFFFHSLFLLPSSSSTTSSPCTFLSLALSLSSSILVYLILTPLFLSSRSNLPLPVSLSLFFFNRKSRIITNQWRVKKTLTFPILLFAKWIQKPITKEEPIVNINCLLTLIGRKWIIYLYL